MPAPTVLVSLLHFTQRKRLPSDHFDTALIDQSCKRLQELARTLGADHRSANAALPGLFLRRETGKRDQRSPRLEDGQRTAQGLCSDPIQYQIHILDHALN